MGLSYAREKLGNAIHGMAIGAEPLPIRLADAYVNSLIHIQPERDLPPDLRALYQEIASAFRTTEASGGEGRAMASARAMDHEQANSVAQSIMRLHDKVMLLPRGNNDLKNYS